jgi:hypothetical protein
MPWFNVDDQLPMHPKTVAAGNAAMGLWIRAAAWSMFALTDGYVPLKIARKFGRKTDADRLVSSALWSRVTDGATDGYQFHDWNQYQRSSEQIKADRESARLRKAKQRNSADPSRVTEAVTSRARATKSLKGLGNESHQSGGAAARAPTARCWQCIEHDGYRANGTVCDHVDRRFTAAHGSKQIREQMGWKT